jgi:heat shock protein HslJ
MVALLALAACTSVGSATSSDVRGGGTLDGPVWVLDRAVLTQLGQDVPPGTRADLRFVEGKARGLAVCQDFESDYLAQGPRLHFDPLSTGQGSCGPELAAVRDAYLSALAEIRRYEVGPSQSWLVLVGARGTLTFRARRPSEPSPLQGTGWRLVGIARGGVIGGPIRSSTLTAVFEATTVRGSDGCAAYSARVRTDGASALSFVDVAQPPVLCEGDLMTQAIAYGEHLDDVAGFRVEGRTLTLLDHGGVTLLVFTSRSGA